MLQKNYSWRKGSLLVYDPTFLSSVFQNLGSGCFFRSPAFFSESGRKFCRHFVPPKGGSRYVGDGFEVKEAQKVEASF